MASFTTRVMLRAGTEQEYIQLNSLMAARGFLTTIDSDEGTMYQLPKEEYNIIGNYTKAEVLKLAKDAVSQMPSKVAEILVTESKGRTWSNLRQ